MYKNILFTGLFAAGLLFIAGCKKDNKSATTVFVSTADITNIRSASPGGAVSISATAAGDVDIVGAVSLTERGVCWATTENPTTDSNKIKTGSGTGHFSGDLTGLIYGTTYHVRAYVINNGKTYYGNDVKFLAAVPVELITNGDFELPADPSVVTINQVTSWKTDETDASIIGRGTDTRNTTKYVWMRSSSKSFYQVVGKVPSVASDYAIKFDGNYDWTDWGNGYNTNLCVRFSSYSGTDPARRITIDSVIIQTGGFPGYGNNWGTKTAKFSIPAGSPKTGENLVIEFAVLPYNGGQYDDGVWYDFDNISVVQTLK